MGIGVVVGAIGVGFNGVDSGVSGMGVLTAADSVVAAGEVSDTDGTGAGLGGAVVGVGTAAAPQASKNVKPTSEITCNARKNLRRKI